MEEKVGGFTFYRNWFNVINEMDSDAEKLAAYTTICQMAFQGEENFSVPEIPENGKISPMLHAVRNAYWMAAPCLWARKKDKDKNEKCVAAGKLGGRGHRKGGVESDSFADVIPAKTSLKNFQPMRINGRMTQEWKDYIKTPEDLMFWIKHNHTGPLMPVIYNIDFCTWALNILQCNNWRDNNNRPIANLNNQFFPLSRGWKTYCQNLKEKEAQKEDAKKQALTEEDRDELVRRRNAKAEAEYE